MRRLVSGTAAVAVAVVILGSAGGQPPPGLPMPRVNTAFPPGAKVGNSAEVTVTGADLDEPTGLYFSHPGIKAAYVEPPEPPVDPKKKDEKKDAPPAMKKAAPAAGPHKFKVSVAADVPPGTYDVRAVGKWGVSNPRAFVVGEFPEVPEKEPNNDVPEAQKVDVGTTVLGQIASPTDVDYTVFAGKAGQKVVVAVQASSIDGKTRPMIEVYDAAGRKLASNRNYRDADAVTDLTLPADGDYYVRLFEFTYTSGSADHTYRLTISSAPWVDFVYPTAVEFGKATPVTLYGRNLPGGQPSGFTFDGRPLEKLAVTVTPPADPLAAHRLAVRDQVAPVTALQDGFEYRLKGPAGSSNPVAIYFAREKQVLKKNAGGTKADTAEALAAPCEVAGMITKKNDRDWYSFDAKKGEPVMLELTAERNGTPADFYFSVHNPQAKNDMMGPEQDDDADLLHPTEFYNRTGDPPPYRFVPPMDGKYLVAVGCRESNSLTGPATAYRLRVGPPRPDFRVVARPYSKSYQAGSAARQDGTEAVEVYVHRMDGFTGEVAVTAENLPAGVTTKGTTIGGGARWGVLVLNVAANAAPAVAEIKVKATATADGKQVVREARPATVTWGIANQQGNNTPVLGRLAQSLVIAVRPEKAFFKLAADPAGAVVKTAAGKDEKVSGPIFVKQGEKLTLPVKVAWVSPDKQNVTVAADPVFPGQQAVPFTVAAGTQPTKDKAEGAVTVDVKATAFPGKYAVTLRGESPVPFAREGAKDKGKATPAVAFADPVEFTVLPTSLVKVAPGQVANGTIKLGTKAELLLKLDRQYDYAGPLKVKFAAPMGLTGVAADEVTVPAGKGDEAKLLIAVAADAKAGAVSNAVITVTGTFAGKEIATETKVNFNVAK